MQMTTSNLCRKEFGSSGWMRRTLNLFSVETLSRETRQAALPAQAKPRFLGLTKTSA